MRLAEIEKRLAEIKTELDNEAADIDALEVEIRGLQEERKTITDKAEKRKALITEVVDLPKTEVIKEFKTDTEERKLEFTNDNVLASKEYRSAWAKTMMGMDLSEIEQRALGTALTTTATTYVGATSEVNGVNNGGLFIPTDVMLDLMERMELASPFFRDIPKTSVSGYVKFPYRKSGTGAEKQTEGVANKDGQVEWGEITLTVLEVSETIRVTWKLEAMAVDSFVSYIIDELAIAIPEKIAADLFYGNGTGTLTGATVGALDGEYTIGTSSGEVADIYGALEAGIALLSDPRKRMGAKIYVAQDIMDAMLFERDDEHRYLHNPINGIGINALAKYPVEVDPFLDDGDFIIGNPRFYRFNWNEGVSIVKDVSGKNRINDYTGYAVVSGAPQPSSFVYGKKSS